MTRFKNGQRTSIDIPPKKKYRNGQQAYEKIPNFTNH